MIPTQSSLYPISSSRIIAVENQCRRFEGEVLSLIDQLACFPKEQAEAL